MRYVLIEAFCCVVSSSYKGYTESAVRAKIKSGEWATVARRGVSPLPPTPYTEKI